MTDLLFVRNEGGIATVLEDGSVLVVPRYSVWAPRGGGELVYLVNDVLQALPPESELIPPPEPEPEADNA